MMDGIRPQTFVKVKNQDGKDKVVNVEKISTIDVIKDAVVIKDDNERVIGRLENSNQKPQDIAEKLGNVIDLVG